MVYWVYGLNTAIGLLSIVAILASSEFGNLAENITLITLLIAFLVNSLICAGIYYKNLFALKFSAWFCFIQIFSFETQDLSLQLNSGLQMTVSWQMDNGAFAVNLATIALWVLLWFALKSVKGQQNKTYPLTHELQ